MFRTLLCCHLNFKGFVLLTNFGLTHLPLWNEYCPSKQPLNKYLFASNGRIKTLCFFKGKYYSRREYARRTKLADGKKKNNKSAAYIRNTSTPKNTTQNQAGLEQSNEYQSVCIRVSTTTTFFIYIKI